MKKIQLTQGKYALVDDSDYKELNQYSWYYHKAGYALRTCHKPRNGKKQETYKVYMHHAIMGKHPGMEVDHINGDSLDNRRENLRVCTPAQNHVNAKKTSNKKSSQFKGVHYHQRDCTYITKVAGSVVGYFKDEEEAARAYNAKAKELFGEFALLNTI